MFSSMRGAILLFLVGCGAPEVVPRAPEPVQEVVFSPIRYVQPDYESPRRESAGKHEFCGHMKAKKAEYLAELASEKPKEGCLPTLKREVWIHPDGGRAPQRAWICDGKLVDTLESPRHQWLVLRVGNINWWLQKHHCE